ncbi:MAG: hypothetical protein AAFX87_04670 [Bacteroidota bacterium]
MQIDMVISFDLDDTLIPSGANPFLTEKQSLIHRIMGVERLRKGSPSLIKYLQNKGH